MPLERSKGEPHLDQESLAHILFPMRAADRLVPCRVSCEALIQVLGTPGADPLAVFARYRPTIEDLASEKFDLKPDVELVDVTTADLTMHGGER